MITQDVQDAVARLLHAIDNSAPTAPPQAAPNWNAEMERQITATKNAQALADQLEAVVDKERARADDLLKQLKQVCAERDQYGRAILRAADDCTELERQLAELTQLVGAETPIAALTLAQTWQAERAEMRERIEQADDALAGMVNQYMSFPEGYVTHEFMGAQEDAIEYLTIIGWLKDGELERYYWTAASGYAKEAQP